jgi:hypothetical protein
MPLASSPRQKYVPRHRQPRRVRLARSAPGTVVRNTVMLSSVAVAATGVPVVSGVLDGADPIASDASTTAPRAARLSEAQLEDRAEAVSRSDSREGTDRQKAAALSQAEGPAVTRSEDLSEADPREIGQALLPEYGFSADQFSCLDALYVSESDWRVDADNPTSSAYGIPQALTSMHDLPPDYYTSAEAQIRWGLEYIQDSYGTPCAAWEFKQANNWY